MTLFKKSIGVIKEGTEFFFRDILKNRFQIIELTKRAFMQRFVGSYLGVAWAFLEPLAMVLIMVLVFEVGLKARPSGNVPFVAYLIVGLNAFSFLSDSIAGNVFIIREYSYLVQKVKFRVSILPIVKLNSSLVLHFVLMIITVVVLFFQGIQPSWYWLQVCYYLACACGLILGLGWMTSAVGVFFQDLGPIISIILRFSFWLTPIFWDINIMPEKYKIFIKLNPFFYIIQGYRDSLIHRVGFWEHPYMAGYFWVVTLSILFFGVFIFRKLRPHFADNI